MMNCLRYNVKSALQVSNLSVSHLYVIPSCSLCTPLPERRPKADGRKENDALSQNDSPDQETPSTTSKQEELKNSFEDTKRVEATLNPATVEKKPFLSRFFGGVATKIEEAATADVPPQFTHPLMKGFVINKIDTAMLVYPEYDETSHVMEAEGFAKQIERLISTKLDSVECDTNKHIPENLIKDCKELGLFGLSIPKKYGGLGMNYKFLSRCHEELSRDWSLYTMLTAHNDLAAKAIELFGTDAQKREYLPRLASGQSVGAFCLHEDCCGQDVASMETTATYVDDPAGGFMLSGQKSWITNAVNADILVVFAKLKNDTENQVMRSTAFIIDRKTVSGVKDIDRKDTMGLRGVNISGLHFDHVRLPASSLLGIEEHGFEIALRTASVNRFLFATAASAFIKRTLAQVVKHCNMTKRWGVMLSDSNTVKARVAKIGQSIFALETMAYYIAGWLDDNPTKDFSLESAAAMRFARQALKDGLFSMMEIMGAESRSTSLHFDRSLRDILTLSAAMSTDDVYSGYIANEVFKVFAAEHQTVLYKAKNAIQFPWDHLTYKLRRMELYGDTVKIQHYINEHVHPSLELSCRTIEDVMAKFEAIFQSVVFSTGKAVEDETIVLERVTDILTNLFVMITAVSRASRSYCIGLRNADMEMAIADGLCSDLRVKTIHILTELTEIDAPNTIDLYQKELGTSLMDHRGYPLERPTTRNCDPAMKQFLLHLDENLALGVKFIIKDLDDSHLFISQESVVTLQQKIDALMDSVSPDFSDK